MANLNPGVRTTRMYLRLFQADDLAPLDAIHGDPEVMRFLGAGAGRGKTRTPAENWSFMQSCLGQWALRGYGIWAIELAETAR